MPATTEASSMWRFETCMITMPCGASFDEIGRHRLARHQVDRDRVGRERVEHDQVVLVRALGQRQARIAEHDRHVRRAFGEIAEVVRIARHLLHGRVDLVEGEVVARLREAREGAGAEPDHRDLDRAADARARRLDGDAHRRIVVIVGDHRRLAGDRLAGIVLRSRSAPWIVVPCRNTRKRPSAVSVILCTPKKLRIVSRISLSGR